MYRQPEGATPLTTKGLSADIAVLEDLPYRASVKITHQWLIPASADELLDQEQRELVYYPNRKAQRSKTLLPMEIVTVLSLEADGKGLQIETKLNNQAKDHRVRMLFPTDIQAAQHRVDSMFEVAERDNKPAPEWENPSNTQHQQAFVEVGDGEDGLVVANLGLNEYEVLLDGRNTIAVTLLRAVGELGDWGLFPTPEAQCLGEHTFHMEVIPYSGGELGALNAYTEAYQFQIPWTVCQTDVHEGTVAPNYSPLLWESAELAFSSLKMNEETGDLLLRWYNMCRQDTELSLKLEIPSNHIYKTTILEEPGQPLTVNAIGGLSLPVGSCEIVTLGINRADK